MNSAVSDFDTLPIVNGARFILGILACLGNSYILLLFFYSYRLRTHAATILIALLCICDLLVGIGLLIRATHSVLNTSAFYLKSTCYAVNSLIGIGKTSCEIVTLAIALDRFYAVYHPLRYSKAEKSLFFIIQTSITAILISGALTWAKQYEVDNSILITVCTAAAATGPWSFLVSTVYTGMFLVLLYSVYTMTFLMLISKTQATTYQTKIKFQKRIFVSVSLIILCYTVFYGLPFLASLMSVIFRFPPSIKAYITLFSGIASGLNSTIDAIIYLTKNDEIKKASLSFLSQWIPSLSKLKSNSTLPTIGTSVAANIKNSLNNNPNSMLYIS